MKIGFDIDDTLNNMRYTFLNILNRQFGTDITSQQLDQDGSFFVGETFLSLGITQTLHEDLWISHQDDTLDSTIPLPFAVEALRELKEIGHDIYYVSARPEEYRAMTFLWLKWYGFPVTPSHLFVGMTDLEKAGILAEQGIECFVDDRVHILESVKQAGIRAIVKSQCYNQEWQGERIPLWSDAVPVILGLNP